MWLICYISAGRPFVKVLYAVYTLQTFKRPKPGHFAILQIAKTFSSFDTTLNSCTSRKLGCKIATHFAWNEQNSALDICFFTSWVEDNRAIRLGKYIVGNVDIINRVCYVASKMSYLVTRLIPSTKIVENSFVWRNWAYFKSSASFLILTND